MMFMKKKILLAFLLAMPLLSSAQTVDASAHGYNVRYEKAHLFLQKGADFNVVDYDLEWPDIVSFNDVAPLKRYMTDMLLDYPTASLDSALMYIGDEYGKPVTGKFKTIPDDDHFCYVTEDAKILSYEPYRWIAYVLKRTVKPQKASSNKPVEQSRVIVYDLTQSKVLFADDMLRAGVMDWEMPNDFYNRLFAPLDDDFLNNLLSAKISGVWILDGQINLHVDAISNDGAQTYTITLPYDEYYYILSREARRMVEKKLKNPSRQFISLPVTWEGDSVYNKVEQMPQFKGGEEGLRRYLSFVSNPGVNITKPERAYVSFIVDKTGNIHQVSVVSPANSELDEHAVNVIKGMPPFSPGKQNGKPVCVRMFMPVNYKP